MGCGSSQTTRERGLQNSRPSGSIARNATEESCKAIMQKLEGHVDAADVLDEHGRGGFKTSHHRCDRDSSSPQRRVQWANSCADTRSREEMDEMDEPITVRGGIIIVGGTLATRIEEKTAHIDLLHASLDSEEFLRNCISAARRGGLNNTRDVAAKALGNRTSVGGRSLRV